MIFLPLGVLAQSIRLVNPFIGTDKTADLFHGGHVLPAGNVFPGACLPYSKVSVSPDVVYPQSSAGYYPNKPIIGFSQTHLSGTGGIGRYGNFLIFPQAGNIDWNNLSSPVINETASPAYYAATLSKDSIKAEMTLTENVGFHHYKFSGKAIANIILDISSTVRNRPPTSKCKLAYGKITGSNQAEGYAEFEGGWGGNNPYRIYFVVEFSTAFNQSGFWDNEGLYQTLKEKKNIAKGDSTVLKTFFSFGDGKSVEDLYIRIAVSYTGFEKARAYLKEAKKIDFTACRKAGEKKWEGYLQKISVKGGTKEQNILLNTSLYHTAIMPRNLTGDNPLWQSKEPHYWDYFCLWDTWHSVNPLGMLIDPDRQSAIIRSLLDIYKHKGWLPDGFTAGDYGFMQGGTNADIVISEAMQKNIKGFDYKLAYTAIKKNATVNSDNPIHYGRYLAPYLKYGYIPATTAADERDKYIEIASSRTLEYAYNDFCIALAAKKMGEKTDYKKYLTQSLNAFNLFDTATKFFWAKDSLGKWLAPFNPDLRYGSWKGPFYEGTARQYSLAALHTMSKLVELHGGKQSFIEYLDDFFDNDFYNPGNEPDLHFPYAYHYAGRPNKSSLALKKIMVKYFHNTSAGLPGNDDAGTLSACYVFASIGLYPVPGQDIYLITAPVFDEVNIKAGGKANLKIVVINMNEENQYIQSALFNGKPLNKSWLRHKDIISGGVLKLVMGDKESGWGATTLPPSFDRL